MTFDCGIAHKPEPMRALQIGTYNPSKGMGSGPLHEAILFCNIVEEKYDEIDGKIVFVGLRGVSNGHYNKSRVPPI